MSLFNVLRTFKTDTVVVDRTASTLPGVDGIFPPGAITSFPIDVVVEPATGMQRVVAGRNLEGDDWIGQSVDDIRTIYTKIELLGRTPTTAPDKVHLEGSTFTVFRVEKWVHRRTTHFRIVLTRDTQGAS